MRTNGYAPIENYAVIGDGRTVGLVASDGSIDWLCLPNVDSPSIFARLLDSERGGSFLVAPAGPFETSRRYVDGTNVLQTTFRTAAGVLRVTDAMTVASDSLSPLREVVRRVECLEGRVEVQWAFEPRFEYASAPVKDLTRRGAHIFASHRSNAVALGVWGLEEAELAPGQARGKGALEAGGRALFSLTAASREPAVLAGRDDAEHRLEQTERFWERWSSRATYDGPWRELVVRSGLVLKLLIFSPSGAIVAAPTASLPEELGGKRNWDYRYTWLRDAVWTLNALFALGYDDEATAFFWWLMHATRRTTPRLGVLYRIDGSHRTTERNAQLSGYRGSRPVRLGNAAARQLQLDVYGAVLDAIWREVETTGDLEATNGRTVAAIADFVARHWREPDSSMWEVRSAEQHFTQSKAMCWVALDRACRLAERGLIPDRAERWRREANAIRRFVEELCWDDDRGSYVRSAEQRELDAGLLTLPLLGFDDPAGPRAAGTIDAVRQELTDGVFVRRYRGEDGVDGEDGAFLACSFWLVEALARSGRRAEAVDLMDRLATRANDVGLYAEEAAADGSFLGNFPQALVHLALISAAVALAAEGSP